MILRQAHASRGREGAVGRIVVEAQIGDHVFTDGYGRGAALAGGATICTRAPPGRVAARSG
jgi:hypothetical protein